MLSTVIYDFFFFIACSFNFISLSFSHHCLYPISMMLTTSLGPILKKAPRVGVFFKFRFLARPHRGRPARRPPRSGEQLRTRRVEKLLVLLSVQASHVRSLNREKDSVLLRHRLRPLELGEACSSLEHVLKSFIKHIFEQNLRIKLFEFTMVGEWAMAGKGEYYPSPFFLCIF